MIPRTLQIKNFLSYGPIQTIDFSHHKLICLSGKNGHGKSALLDAMTWAVWGQARKVATLVKPDQGLLRLGETQMLVVFDFELNGQLYRIRREFMRTHGKPYATLEFGLLEKDTDKFIPLTDKTIRATQAKIEQTLHLDFESFSNSAFLRQGQANEFSKKSAKDRKEVLGTILGLNQYDVIRKRAMEKAKQALTKQQTLHMLQEKLQQELAHKQELTIRKQEVTQELKKYAIQEKEHVKEKEALALLKKTIAEKKHRADLIHFKQEKVTEQQNSIQLDLKERIATWRLIHHKKLGMPDLTKLEKEKTTLIGHIAQHQTLLQKNLTLKEQLLKTKEQAHILLDAHTATQTKIINEHVIQIERLRAEKMSLETTHKTCIEQQAKYTAEYKQIEKESAQLIEQKNKAEKLAQPLIALQEQFEKRKAFYQSLITQGNMVRATLHSTAQKATLVHDEQDPSCPLCEQNLSATRRRMLRQRFANDTRKLEHQVNRIAQYISTLKPLLLAQHKELEHVQNQLNIATNATNKYKELDVTRAKITKTLDELTLQKNTTLDKIAVFEKSITTATTVLTTAQKKQAPNEQLKTLQKQVRDYEQQLSTASYDQNAYSAHQKKLVRIEKQLHDVQTVREQMPLQQERVTHVSALCLQLKKYKKELATLIKTAQKYTSCAQEEQKINANEHALEQHIVDTQQQKEILIREQGKLEAQLKKCDAIEQQITGHKKEESSLNNTIHEYQTIAIATGKDGIQALLIEDAIPEVEQEANELLAKLTNNQAQLFIESLRDLKGGGTKETLDIKISDEIGIRPYEMFSGGEAFRIDFALRIAISKLLARRAGTSLQTLIIDEGFGSQDDEGLSHIMDALYKIQDDFEKIIIVSHLPSLKEQFPVHFIVEKRAHGSTVHIVEHG